MSLDTGDIIILSGVLVVVSASFFTIGYNIGFIKGGQWTAGRFGLDVPLIGGAKRVPSLNPFSGVLCRHKIPIEMCIRCNPSLTVCEHGWSNPDDCPTCRH